MLHTFHTLQSKMVELIIVRGLPGSGKSTYAETHFGSFKRLSADEYFTTSAGVYLYDGSKIAEAHAWCREAATGELRRGNSVVIANTFTRKWEVDSYVGDIRKVIGQHLPVRVIHIAGTTFQNVHGVPGDVVDRMGSRWERYPLEKIVTPDNVCVDLDKMGREYISLSNLYKDLFKCAPTPDQARRLGEAVARRVAPRGGKTVVVKGGKDISINMYTPDQAPLVKRVAMDAMWNVFA